MPFEIPQQEPQVEAPAKVGEFQRFANAMLKGCAVTQPITGKLYDGHGGACAMGALLVGLGHFTVDGGATGLYSPTNEGNEITRMQRAFVQRHTFGIEFHNDNRLLTREQIAARIAAL